ncbi:hypothetical protein B6U79_02475 [Candidatus Bathyarchaeota archaeon ex4484_231]|nr:MAG: hypothetical protein B6U79_02475 [Candidatus Bathyarchaeota archaeon ex4484_231]RJS76820.1 MAG: hypothetical protein CW712_00325 [Candidatus Bathyarchaeota archaeon]
MFSKVVLMLSEPKKCSPECRKFRCGRNSLQFRGKTAWCRWTDEPCNPANCSYAMCVTRRLLPNGLCGETVKRKTTEKTIEEDFIRPIRVRGKTYRKIGEKEIF